MRVRVRVRGRGRGPGRVRVCIRCKVNLYFELTNIQYFRKKSRSKGPSCPHAGAHGLDIF